MSTPLDQIPMGEVYARLQEVMKLYELPIEAATRVVMCEIKADAEAVDEDNIDELDIRPIWTQLGVGPFPDELPEGPLKGGS